MYLLSTKKRGQLLDDIPFLVLYTIVDIPVDHFSFADYLYYSDISWYLRQKEIVMYHPVGSEPPGSCRSRPNLNYDTT